MRLYNQNIDQIQNYESIKGANNETLYVNRVSDAHLNALGYFKVKHLPVPDRRYFRSTEVRGVVNGEFVIEYTPAERPLKDVIDDMIKDLKEAYDKYSIRPRVDSGLGYFVDGSRIDKENFEVGKDLNLPEVKDADNIWHDVVPSDYDVILLAIKQNGVNLWYKKNEIEALIKSLPDVASCIDFEHSPVDYVVTQADVDNDPNLTLGQVIVRYKNKVKEWF